MDVRRYNKRHEVVFEAVTLKAKQTLLEMFDDRCRVLVTVATEHGNDLEDKMEKEWGLDVSL